MGLKIISIASGSKGNCYFIKSTNRCLLVDLGVSYKRMKNALSVLGEDIPGDVFITHEHGDHISGLKTAAKKGMVIHAAPETARAVRHVAGPDSKINEFTPGQDFFFGDITVSTHRASHDVPCVAYSFISEGKKIAVVTDSGFMPEDTLKEISDSDLVVLESNYDPDMLWRNPEYPEELKRRISGREGHLSNDDAAAAATELAKNGVRKIMLAHLSEKNNTPETALKNMKKVLSENGFTDIILIVAEQNTEGAPIEI